MQIFKQISQICLPMRNIPIVMHKSHLLSRNPLRKNVVKCHFSVQSKTILDLQKDQAMYVCNFTDNLLFLGDNGLHTGPQSCYIRRPRPVSSIQLNSAQFSSIQLNLAQFGSIQFSSEFR